MSTTLMQAHNQWAKRPSDERFTSLIDMQAHFELVRSQSNAVVVSSRKIQAEPVEYPLELVDGKPTKKATGLQVTGPNGHAYEPTHWSFGQMAQRVGAPASYLRTLPPEMAADCLNYGFQISRDVEDVGVLVQQNGSNVLRAMTGPGYGRIWNSEVINGLVNRFGDGVSGPWKVPGEFGKAVTVTKANTTLYASDRDCFIFLCNEENRITIPNRRDGKSGDLARGFFVWNSETGAKKFGIATFYFDFVCCNRMIWGSEGYKEFSFRHTSSAPERFIEEVAPALDRYAEGSSSQGIVQAIKDAQNDKLGDKLEEFVKRRFSRNILQQLKTVHQAEEGRPLETRFDVVTAATALARGIEHQDTRVELELEAAKCF